MAQAKAKKKIGGKRAGAGHPKGLKNTKVRSDKINFNEAQINQIVVWIAGGASQKTVASLLKISPDTLSRRINENPELRAVVDNAREIASASVVKSLHTAAILGDVTAQKFWLSKLGGEQWKDKPIEITGKGGAPIDVAHTVQALTEMSPEQRRAELERMEKINKLPGGTK